MKGENPMKRISALILAMLMCFSVLVACGGKTEEPAATTTAAASDNAGGADATTAATEPAETEEQLEIEIKPEYNGKVINILCKFFF